MTEKLWLPHVLREIADTFDEAVALRFAAEFGGHRLKLPVTAYPEHKVVAQFGMALLEFLIARFGGDHAILVPLGPRATYFTLIRTIRRMVTEGYALDEIVKATGCHERTVRRHRAALREGRVDDRQLALF